MVEYKKRFVHDTTSEYFKELGRVSRDILSSRVKLEDVKEFCYEDDPLIEFLEDKRVVEGARLLKKHIDAGSSILVITDGDCDGISCASIANLFFRNELNLYPTESLDTDVACTDVPTITPYEQAGMDKGTLKITVNDRKYGNGVNLVHAKDILKQKPDLIITADHGSSDHDSFELIRDILPNTDILITDHHIVPDNVVPIHDAFINPQELGSSLGKALCGAAVLYLLFRKYANKELEYLYPILGLATVVDQMSLNIGYNRFLYKQANKYLRHFKPFRAYTKYVEHRYLWSTEFYSIGLGPLINSTKRMDMPIIGYRFLTSQSDSDIFKYYKEMVDTNKSRKKQQEQVEESIKESVTKDRVNYKKSRVALTDIRNGVNGILASRLVENDHVPAFVFHKVGKMYAGSGRGHGDFDVEGLISSFRRTYGNVYISGGGHKGAGGLKLKADGMYLFRGMFESLANKVDSTVTVYFDISLPLKLIDSKETRKQLRGLQPFGRGFDYPVFETTGYIKGYKQYGASFFIYTVVSDNQIYKMMRFSELLDVTYDSLVTLYVSPRGKKDFILLDKK